MSVTVGAYRGDVRIDSAGLARSVPALRQLTVASVGRPPASPDALQLEPSDLWDLRYLGLAFELTDRLDPLARAYTANEGTAGATAAALQRVLPDLTAEPAFGPALLADPNVGNRPAGELLVGLTIALLGRGDSFAERVGEVQGFRDDGAEWGLVAVDQGLAGGSLVGTVESAIRRASPGLGSVAAGSATLGAPNRELATGSSAPSPATPSGSTPTPTGTPSSSPPGGLAPPTSSPSTEVTVPTVPAVTPPDEGVLPDTGVPVVDDVVDPVDDLLGGILGGP